MVFSNINWRNFSVKKGKLPLRWVSSPGPFDCRTNALSSELRSFHNFSHRNLLTPTWLRINRELFSDFSKSFQSIMSIIRKVYHCTRITELYYIDLINLWFRINLTLFKTRWWEKLWKLRSSDDRAFDRQSKNPGLDTQRSITEKFLLFCKIFAQKKTWKMLLNF